MRGRKGLAKVTFGMQLIKTWHGEQDEGMKQDNPLALVTENSSRIVEIHRGSVLKMANFQTWWEQ